MRFMWGCALLVACGGNGADCEQVTWFVDADRDGFGAADSVTGCADARPANAVNVPGDCDDADSARSPDAVERCNAIDDDCDGRIDDADTDVDPADLATFYVDGDQDGFGDDAQEVLACDTPTGASAEGGDCNDADALAYPGAPETCADVADLNCDGAAPHDDADFDGVAACEDCDDGDDALGLAPRWYADLDEDGFGNPDQFTTSCLQPPDTADNGEDCDDGNGAISPAADERCDDIDNDCDGLIDDLDPVVVGAPRWYTDADMDGYGNPFDFVTQCDPVENTVTNGADCDDLDETVGTRTPWYPDNDGDGYGDENASATSACVAPPDTVANDLDCDDTDPALNPDTIWYVDSDDDGFGDPDTTTTGCVQPADGVSDDTDCDDSTHLVYPGRFDFGDGIDNDCDTSVDEDVGTEAYDSIDIQDLVDTECSGCHTGGATSGGLNMDDFYASTVNVGSSSALDYIVPGDLRSSYLWHKLQGTQGGVTGGSGDQMPQGTAPLADADLDVFETWIFEGAIE